jgi:uncharacterized RDD family membrane protein YckC
VQFPAPSYAEPTGAQYAQWATRLGGWLIDFVIFIPVAIVLLIAFHHTHVLQFHLMSRHHAGKVRHVSGLALVVQAVLFLGYVTVLTGGPRGQTVGMMAVGIKVVRDGSSEALGYGKALVRALVEQVFRATLLGIILGLVWLLDMLWPLWDKKRQTLHDKVVGTVVVRVRN